MQTEAFEAHPAWSTLTALEQQLDGNLAPTPDAQEHVRRLHSMVEYVDALRDVDPLLVEQAAIDDLNTNLTQISNHLTNYRSDMDANAGHLVSAAGQVANVMSATRLFPTPSADDATRATKAAATRYKNALDADAQTLHDQIEALQAQLAAEQAERETVATTSQASLSELQAAVTASVEQVSALESQLAGQIATQRTAYEQEVANRASEFTANEKVRNASEAERIKTAEEAATAALAAQESTAAESIKRLEQFEEQAAALVDTTSRHAIAGDYGTWAAAQAKAAFWWTVATTAIGIITVGAVAVVVKTASDDSVQFILSKLSVSVIGLIVAGYTARQAAEHRKEERTAKRLALDLAALEPFLEHVENPEELRTTIAKRVFAPEQPAGSDGEPRIRLRRNALSLQQVLDLVLAAQKKV